MKGLRPIPLRLQKRRGGEFEGSAMRRAYIAQDATEAHFVKSILEDHGIQAVVRGENLQLVRGEASLMNAYPEVFVGDDANMELIKELLTKYEARRAGNSDDNRPPWTCPKCGEKMEGSFTECWQCAPKDTQV